MRQRLTAAVCVAGLLAAGAAWAQDEEFGVIKWSQLPGERPLTDILRHYGPSKGSAQVECTLNAQRRPDKCRVLEQEIPGDGRLASKIAELYKASELDTVGVPVEGRKVCLAFDFRVNARRPKTCDGHELWGPRSGS